MKRVLFCLLIVIPGPVAASEDHDLARSAVRQHKVLPLAEIIPKVQDLLDARLLEAEFEQDDGVYVYELELITGAGRMIEVMVDAATGEILEVEQDDWPERDD